MRRESRKCRTSTGANLQGHFYSARSRRRPFHGDLRHASLVQADLCMPICWEPNCAAQILMGDLIWSRGPLLGAWVRESIRRMLREPSPIDARSCLGSHSQRALILFSDAYDCSLCVLVLHHSDPRLILDGQTIPHRASRQYSAHQRVLLDRSDISGVMFVRFQFLLLRVWSSMAALPPVFPDGPDRLSTAVRGT